MQVELPMKQAVMISFFPGLTTAAVCVYPARVCDAVKALKAAGCTIPVASGKIIVAFAACFQFSTQTPEGFVYRFI